MQRPNKALKETELDILDAFLAQRDDAGRGMPLTMADGFMTAVASGPRFFPSEAWLPEIFDLDALPETSDGADLSREDATALTLRRYNDIINALEDEDPDLILARSDADDVADELCSGELWCLGYLRGIDLDAAGWQPLLDDERAPEGIDDVFFLATPLTARDAKGEIDPESAAAYAEFQATTPKERSEIALNLVDTAWEIYDYWYETRRLNTRVMPIKAAPKVGRNEACPCGSGKKYKRCCAA